MELLELLEKKLEQVLSQFQKLKADSAELVKELEAKELALLEAKEAMDKMAQERELVRQRVDQLLNKIEALAVEDEGK